MSESSNETPRAPVHETDDPPQNGDRPYVEPEKPRRGGDDGVIRASSGSLKIPEGIAPGEEPENGRRSATVLIVIVAGAIAFILFIAWLIAEGAR